MPCRYLKGKPQTFVYILWWLNDKRLTTNMQKSNVLLCIPQGDETALKKKPMQKTALAKKGSYTSWNGAIFGVQLGNRIIQLL